MNAPGRPPDGVSSGRGLQLSWQGGQKARGPQMLRTLLQQGPSLLVQRHVQCILLPAKKTKRDFSRKAIKYWPLKFNNPSPSKFEVWFFILNYTSLIISVLHKVLQKVQPSQL